MLTGTNGGTYSLGTIELSDPDPVAGAVPNLRIAKIPVIGGISTDSLVLTIFEDSVSTSDGTVVSGPDGGQFDFYFNVLVGDEDTSAQVNSSDAFAVFSSNTDAVSELNFRRDIDGSGQINSSDAFAAFANNTNGLPLDTPTPPSPPATFVMESFSAVAALAESVSAITTPVSVLSPVASVSAPVVSLVRSFEIDSVETEAVTGSSVDAVVDSSPELALVGASSVTSLSLDAGFEIADDEYQTSFEVRDDLFGDLENSELLPELL